jgi:transcription elongation factor Elf1
MICDFLSENIVYPDSIRAKGYFNTVKFTCPSCLHKNEMQIPISGTVEKLLCYCAGCGSMLMVDMEGLDGEE